jgi:histidyl-tRNA synthetase
MGLDRILIAMQAEGVPLPPPRTPRCFVVAIGAAAEAGIRLVGELRAAGIPAESALEERPLGAQLRTADRAGAAFAAILGDRELESGTVTMRRLADGEQDEVPFTDVVNWLSRQDGSVEP